MASKQLNKKQKPALTSVRLDKWLWAARFFKTRRNAVDAISGGKVHLNGIRTKPAKNIQLGDELLITRENDRYQVEVIGLNDKRRPAKEAALLYQESDESIAARETEREMRKLNSSSIHHPDKKPNKKERRQMDKWRGR